MLTFIPADSQILAVYFTILKDFLFSINYQINDINGSHANRTADSHAKWQACWQPTWQPRWLPWKRHNNIAPFLIVFVGPNSAKIPITITRQHTTYPNPGYRSLDHAGRRSPIHSSSGIPETARVNLIKKPAPRHLVLIVFIVCLLSLRNICELSLCPINKSRSASFQTREYSF